MLHHGFAGETDDSSSEDIPRCQTRPAAPVAIQRYAASCEGSLKVTFIRGFADSEQLQLGSLSHYINTRAVGYEPLPDFPEHPPDSSVRDVEPINTAAENKSNEVSTKGKSVAAVICYGWCLFPERQGQEAVPVGVGGQLRVGQVREQLGEERRQLLRRERQRQREQRLGGGIV